MGVTLVKVIIMVVQFFKPSGIKFACLCDWENFVLRLSFCTKLRFLSDEGLKVVFNAERGGMFRKVGLGEVYIEYFQFQISN